MSHVRVAAVMMVGVAMVSCQTITEDMPTVTRLSAPAPIVYQIPLPNLGTPQPTRAPSNGDGGGGGVAPPIGQPQQSPTAQPVPTAKPTARPTDPPNDAPPPSNNGCEGFPANCNPVATIHAYTYYIVCNGDVLPDTKFVGEGPSDCDVRLDATPKDAKGKHTQAKGSPEWTIQGGYSWEAKNPYTPLVRGGRSGEITAWVEIDGVRSNTFTYRFR